MNKIITRIALFLACFSVTIDAAENTTLQKIKDFYWKYNFKAQVISSSITLLSKNLITQDNQNQLIYGSEPIKAESLVALFTQNLLALKLNPAHVKICAIRTDWVDLYRSQGVFMMQTDRVIWIDEQFFLTELTEKQQKATIAYLCIGLASNFILWDSLMAVVTGIGAVGLNLCLEKNLSKHISPDQSQWGPYLENWAAYLIAIYTAQYANTKMLELSKRNRTHMLCKKYVSLGNNPQDLIEVFTLSDEMSGSDSYLFSTNQLKALIK